MPRTRSAAGLRGAPGTPYVSLGIIATCVAVWLGEMSSDTFFLKIAFVAEWAKDEPWRFVTSGFAHSTASPLHLLFNMYALYIVGQYLEPLMGRVRFGALYLLSVLGGSVGYEVLTAPSGHDLAGSGWSASLVGASGGVFGLFLAVVVLNRQLGREIRPMITLIGINVVIGFMPGVAWQAHVGGAIAGAVGAGLIYGLRKRAVMAQYLALAAEGIVLFAVAYGVFATVSMPA